MYLPLFFEKYYPAYDKDKEGDLFPIINACANIMYGESWDPSKKVIAFKKSHGELKKIHFLFLQFLLFYTWMNFDKVKIYNK